MNSASAPVVPAENTRARRGRLCLVPAPLDFGIEAQATELQDQLPLGAIRRAANLQVWVVENAKSARAFLKRVDAIVPLAKPLQQMQMTELPRPTKGKTHGHAAAETPSNRADVWRNLLTPAEQGLDIGLLSEAGLVGVADPGAALVMQAHAIGIAVEVLPGASALTLALAGSGMNGQSFAFHGYLPNTDPDRSKRIVELEVQSARLRQTQLFIETPYRNEVMFSALLGALKKQTQLLVAQALGSAQARVQTHTVSNWSRSPLKPGNDIPCVFGILAA